MRLIAFVAFPFFATAIMMVIIWFLEKIGIAAVPFDIKIVIMLAFFAFGALRRSIFGAESGTDVAALLSALRSRADPLGERDGETNGDTYQSSLSPLYFLYFNALYRLSPATGGTKTP